MAVNLFISRLLFLHFADGILFVSLAIIIEV